LLAKTKAELYVGEGSIGKQNVAVLINNEVIWGGEAQTSIIIQQRFGEISGWIECEEARWGSHINAIGTINDRSIDIPCSVDGINPEDLPSDCSWWASMSEI
jgi:hypothetical protein